VVPSLNRKGRARARGGGWRITDLTDRWGPQSVLLAEPSTGCVSLWYTFLLCDSWGCRSGGWVGELQWTALPYTSSLLKSAAPRPRSPKPSKGSHHLRLNSPSRTGEPNPTPNPPSRFGRLLQNAAAQDGCRPAEQAGLADGADPDRPHRWLRRPLHSCHPTKKGPSSGTMPWTRSRRATLITIVGWRNWDKYQGTRGSARSSPAMRRARAARL
jgi:hypothetical protein